MQTLKINFGYFWPGFDNEDNYFTRILSQKYNVEISDKPDIYFFTHPYNGKRDYLKFKCHRVFLGWENVRANWNICDYVLDSDFYINKANHKRWPIWAAWHPEKLTNPKQTDLFLGKKKFACMVVSNGNAKERIDFFHLLSKYKKVDSGGRFLNNIGGPVNDKMNFIKEYKFVISFENSSYPGYTTEKLIQPMLANSIPVYWGNPEVGKDFNTKSFININDFSTYQQAIERIIELDNDEIKYRKVAEEPWFINNQLPDEFTEQSFSDFFDFILNDMKTKKPVAHSLNKHLCHSFSIFTNKIFNRVFHKLTINNELG